MNEAEREREKERLKVCRKHASAGDISRCVYSCVRGLFTNSRYIARFIHIYIYICTLEFCLTIMLTRVRNIVGSKSSDLRQNIFRRMSNT